MIQIKHLDIARIVDTHYKFVYNDAASRLDFYIDLLNVLGHNVSIPKYQSICDRYGFSRAATPQTLIDPFLKKAYRKSGKKYNVTMNQIESVFFSCNKYIIADQNKFEFFKEAKLFFSSVKSNLKKFICGDPKILQAYTIDTFYLLQRHPFYKKCIERIFRYEKLIGEGFKLGTDNWNSYSLTSKLDLSTCPYCNRNWINTVTTEGEKKIVNPQLDHFFCKAKFPLLRISFYNLIPSCDTCNTRLKKSDQFNLEEYIHPYLDGYNDAVRFRALATDVQSSIGSARNFIISIEHNPLNFENKQRINNSHETFKINEIYAMHGDIVGEIFRKRYLFSINYLETLKRMIKTHDLDEEEMYRIAFGNYLNDIDFKKRPFSKLTRDIASQLGLIKI